MGRLSPVRVLLERATGRRELSNRGSREGSRVAAQESNVVDLFGPRRDGVVRRSRVDEPRVTKKEVAARFGVSTKTVERYMGRKANPLPFEKPHERGAVRFVMSEVEAWWRQASEVERPAAAS